MFIKHFLKLILCVLFFTCNYSFAETKTLTSEFTQDSFSVSVLNQDELDTLFDYLSTRKSIPFHVIQDGCYARSYLMTTAAGLKNVSLAKRVIETTNSMPMIIPSDDFKWQLRWYYHVAPIVYLKTKNGEIVERVIDPSLFDRPVSSDEFIDFLMQNSPNTIAETFILPKFISGKDEYIKDINMRRLDQLMLVSLSEVVSRDKKFGTFHEKKAYFDPVAKAWFKGGWPVEAPAKPIKIL